MTRVNVSPGQPGGSVEHSCAAASLVPLAILLAACWRTPPVQVPGGDAARGRLAVASYGCGACHTIAHLDDAHGLVGPPLDGIGRRAVIGGILPNTPENLPLWIQHPRAVAPGTAMPDLGVSSASARDIAAYLYTLR